MAETIKKKVFYESKELWILFMAVLLVITKYLGLDLPGILDEASNIYVNMSPLLALIIRVLFTNSKIALKKAK